MSKDSSIWACLQQNTDNINLTQASQQASACTFVHALGAQDAALCLCFVHSLT
jgi:hypothetical protein